MLCLLDQFCQIRCYDWRTSQCKLRSYKLLGLQCLTYASGDLMFQCLNLWRGAFKLCPSQYGHWGSGALLILCSNSYHDFWHYNTLGDHPNYASTLEIVMSFRMTNGWKIVIVRWMNIWMILYEIIMNVLVCEDKEHRKTYTLRLHKEMQTT